MKLLRFLSGIVVRWWHCLSKTVRYLEKQDHRAVNVTTKGKVKIYCTCGHYFGEI